jgi:hypothetical protein
LRERVRRRHRPQTEAIIDGHAETLPRRNGMVAISRKKMGKGKIGKKMLGIYKDIELKRKYPLPLT